MSNIICCCVRTSARLRTLRSHFLPLPFFFLLVFLLFLRPPGITGLIAGALVGDGFGAAAVSAVAGAGASAAGAGASAVVVASALVLCGKTEATKSNRSATRRRPPCVCDGQLT